MAALNRILVATDFSHQPHLLVLGARGEHESYTEAPFLGGTALKLVACTDIPALLVRQSRTPRYRVSVAAVSGS